MIKLHRKQVRHKVTYKTRKTLIYIQNKNDIKLSAKQRRQTVTYKTRKT